MAKSEMKQKLCEELLKNGIEENSVVRHSYTSNRLNKGDKNLKRVESKDKGLAPTLDTRCDCLGIATKRYKNYITWKNKKGEFNTECNRASLPNDLALTVATANIGKVIDNARERERESRITLRLENSRLLSVLNLWVLKSKITKLCDKLV